MIPDTKNETKGSRREETEGSKYGNSNFVTGARIAVLLWIFLVGRGITIKITAILAPVTKVTFFQERFIISNFLF